MTTKSHSPSASKGALSAFGCFLAWGLFPLYWKQLHSILPLEAVAHRAFWSVFFLLGVLAWQRALPELFTALRNPRQVRLSLFSGLLLAANWTIYVWAVNSGQVIESSLGYFLVPLVNVALGRLIFHEHLRRIQILAIGLAAVGVGLLLVRMGHVPYVALGLAGTWGSYGLLKKKSSLNPVVGLSVETVVLLPLAIGVLIWANRNGGGGFGDVDLRTRAFILGAGVVTAVPLVCFAYGAQRIRMTTLGLLQYITPSVQFLLGYWLYSESFDGTRFQSYGLIWLGLALYSFDSIQAQREKSSLPTTPMTPICAEPSK